MPNAECLAIDNPGSKIRHSREGGNPQFPRTREFIVPLHQSPKKHSAIPAKAEIHPITRHSCKGGNPPHHPPFLQRQESTPLPVIPAEAGIHNSRVCGNSSGHYIKAQKNTPPFPRRRKSTPSPAIPAKAEIHPITRAFRPITSKPKGKEIHPITRHSCKGRNPPHQPSFPRRRESTIPAYAGIHRPITSKPKKTLRHSRMRGNPPHHPPFLQSKGGNPPHHPPFLQRQESTPSAVIPAEAGIHNSRARGNSSSHYIKAQKNTPPFPRRRKSTPSPAIPAKAEIHPISRHSREGGNPQFPRMREFIGPLHQSPKKHSAIPAKAEIHPITRHSCKGRNPPHQPSFPRRRESTIPADAGIHRPITSKPEKTLRHSRMRGNPPHHPPFPRRRE